MTFHFFSYHFFSSRNTTIPTNKRYMLVQRREPPTVRVGEGSWLTIIYFLFLSHSLLHSLLHTFIHSYVHSFAVVRFPFFLSLFLSFFLSFSRSFVRSFIARSTHLSTFISFDNLFSLSLSLPPPLSLSLSHIALLSQLYITTMFHCSAHGYSDNKEM